MTDSITNPKRFEALFVGDLSFFCKDEDLQLLFEPYGPVGKAVVRKSKNKHEPLHYGFVEIPWENSNAAIEALNGTVFLGRKLRIGVYKFKMPDIHKDLVSLHVSFLSRLTTFVINEAFLSNEFSKFGEVQDCVIKQYCSTPSSGSPRQYGYAFVYYRTVDAAQAALSHLQRESIMNNVKYACNLSHDFQQPGMNENRLWDSNHPKSVSPKANRGNPPLPSPTLSIPDSVQYLYNSKSPNSYRMSQTQLIGVPPTNWVFAESQSGSADSFDAMNVPYTLIAEPSAHGVSSQATMYEQHIQFGSSDSSSPTNDGRHQHQLGSVPYIPVLQYIPQFPGMHPYHSSLTPQLQTTGMPMMHPRAVANSAHYNAMYNAALINNLNNQAYPVSMTHHSQQSAPNTFVTMQHNLSPHYSLQPAQQFHSYSSPLDPSSLPPAFVAASQAPLTPSNPSPQHQSFPHRRNISQNMQSPSRHPYASSSGPTRGAEK
mmetsp:Transcript_11655/g.8515  ORF Transcript_11655/g.8515 Transcript_11655/m.8515 type:complete len:485 (-) Transcript_11655:911-2365(-)|eukprot:CAMPEP_0202958668 /NCGR_PEP_ID=MMETSP1396-20130829/2947_1 /ASSEMBLY_ACC=CAM_ASM_000872 /TAXON_ID= /ORGANISM="Pseudokeronopsis sp., Strain Brazil" /LENGTH=484 /DNA_ID=CAMNT_0049676841 /DNA_START=67 /DNA_END=1524 /DNA_ORIENTATION=+